ncbi:MAG: methyltransferase domain-containing protein [Crocinitomicaceae bacterium]
MEKEFWENRWQTKETQWDIGYASPAIKFYFQTLSNHDLKILIPGCGNAYEAEEIYNLGFKNLYIIDVSESAIASFKARCPSFPEDQIICGDFFDSEILENTAPFDVIVEQTFFCAIHPSMRDDYCLQMSKLLKPEGVLIGLLFDMDKPDGPPFGGRKPEYQQRFEKCFNSVNIQPCKSSIEPRAGKEFWIEMKSPKK